MKHNSQNIITISEETTYTTSLLSSVTFFLFLAYGVIFIKDFSYNGEIRYWTTIVCAVLFFGVIPGLNLFSTMPNLGKTIILWWAINLVGGIFLFAGTLDWIGYIDSMLFPGLFCLGYVIFYFRPQLFFTLKLFGIIGISFGCWNAFRIQALDTVSGQSNGVNHLAGFLPYLFLFRNTWIKIFGFLIYILAMMASLKRSSVFIAIGFILVFIFSKNTNLSLSKKALMAGLGTFMSIALLFFYEDRLSILDRRLENMSDDKGSGRLDLWITTWERMTSLKDGIGAWFFGNGYDSTSYNLGFCAHNDFFQILYDKGLPGVFVWLLILFFWGKHTLDFRKHENPFSDTCTMALIVMTVATMVICTYVFYQAFLPLFFLLGAIFACNARLQKTRQPKLPMSHISHAS